ncbi:MAG TPA: glycoside hydrolase family 5 protein [Rhizomicrobium sp.]|nr:glycoside hydrolase family 5 protein [Rhizomicrobium sp.]
MAQMHRGMNILDDDPLWRDAAAARFRPRHFAVLRAAGFDTVRLNLHLIAHPDALPAIDRLVKAGLDAGLTVILDMHEDRFCARDADACRTKLRAAWTTLATRYRDAPNRLLFELLNEPHGRVTIAVWNTLLRELLGIVRASNPERNVVIGSANMSSLWDLHTLDLPEGDRHIIATVHTYTPVSFTLQGAPWVPEADKMGVTWGSDADMAALVKAFDGVQSWSERERRPVLLGEFGVYYKVPMEQRTRWLAAVARVAEAHGLAWAYWQMDTDFAAYDFARGTWIAPVLKALVP